MRAPEYVKEFSKLFMYQNKLLTLVFILSIHG